MADPDERRVVVRPSTENLLLGQDVRLTSLVRDAGYRPIADVPVQGWVESPSGERATFDVVTGASGEAMVPFTPMVAGAHRVHVSTADGGDAETVFSVTTRDPELADIAPDAAFLQKLSQAYGTRGAYRSVGDETPPLTDEKAQRLISEQRQTSLAALPFTALLFGLFSSLAWWIRRRNGGR